MSNTHWSEVIVIDKRQSAAHRKLCAQTLDFWQQRDPALFARIADTQPYRDGKVVFGIDISNTDRSGFDQDGRNHNVNISSKQAKEIFFISGRTGLAVKGTFEDIVYHELIHAGDVKMAKLNDKLNNDLVAFWDKGREYYLEFVAAYEKMAKEPHKYHYYDNELGKYTELTTETTSKMRADIYEAFSGAPSKNGYVKANKIISESVNSLYMPKHYRQEMEHLATGLKIDKIISNRQSYVDKHEEWTVDVTDRAMHKIDPDNQRVKYSNGDMLSESTKEIHSYAAGTVKPVALLSIEELRQQLNQAKNAAASIQQVFASPMIDLGKMDEAAAKFRFAATYIDKTTGMKSRPVSGEVETENADYYHAADKAPKMASSAKGVVKAADKALKLIDELAKAEDVGNERQILKAKRSLSEACDDFSKEAVKLSGKISDITLEANAASGKLMGSTYLYDEDMAKLVANLKKHGCKTHISNDYIGVNGFYVPIAEIRQDKQDLDATLKKSREAINRE